MTSSKLERVPLESFKSPVDDLKGNRLKSKRGPKTFAESAFALNVEEPGLSHFDWREHGLDPRIRHQRGWNCCTSFALTAAVEMLAVRGGAAGPRLNGGYVHFCLAKVTNTKAGINPTHATGKAVEHGIAAGNLDLPDNIAAFCAADGVKPARVTGGQRIDGGVSALDKLVSAGPLLVDMYVPTNFADLGPHETYVCDPMPANSLLHTMVLVGYDWPSRTAIVLNSYGVGWGNEGFATIKLGSGGLLERRPFLVQI